MRPAAHVVNNAIQKVKEYADECIWDELLGRTKNSGISALIVKGMSRPGRDYLKAGFYIKVLFAGKSVGFIAINNGIDSANQQDLRECTI